MEQREKCHAASNQQNEANGLAPAQDRRRHHDRRQQQHRKRVKQPAGEKEQGRQLADIEDQGDEALVTLLADDEGAPGLPDIHRHRQADHEQRRADRNRDFKDDEGEQQRQKLAGERKPADVQDQARVDRAWRAAAPLSRLQHRPDAGGAGH